MHHCESVRPLSLQRIRRLGILLAIAITIVIGFGETPAVAQGRPGYCDQTPATTLSGLQAPYGLRTNPNGKPYCEGLLVRPIAFLPPTVISLKQSQATQPTFTSNGSASLKWCDDSASAVHIRLRSTKIPFFGLDALQGQPFTWRTTLIAAWQRNWDNIAATGTKSVTVSGRKYKVLVPLRVGQGYSSSYALLIQSKNPLAISRALVQPVAPKGNARLVDVSFGGGPSPDTWQIGLPFGALGPGLYRVTFQGEAGAGGVTTAPIYLLHKTCPNNG